MRMNIDVSFVEKRAIKKTSKKGLILYLLLHNVQTVFDACNLNIFQKKKRTKKLTLNSVTVTNS